MAEIELVRADNDPLPRAWQRPCESVWVALEVARELLELSRQVELKITIPWAIEPAPRQHMEIEWHRVTHVQAARMLANLSRWPAPIAIRVPISWDPHARILRLG